MIGVFYTGQARYNLAVARANHIRLISRLIELDGLAIHDFTTNQSESPYTHSGARQIWQFAESLEVLTEDIIVRLRTDVWLEDSAIDCIIKQVKDIQAGNIDIAYFGSDIANGTHDSKDLTTTVDDFTLRVLDFVIVARRSCLNHQQLLDGLSSHSRPQSTGNELFLLLVNGCRAVNVVCQMWLIRKWYDDVPDDQTVCLDHIRSYLKPSTQALLNTALEWAESR